jgi:outer membrane protein OmpA-like peptidoglycan-associated protein
MKHKPTFAVAGIAAALMALQGCSSLPERIETLDQARTSVQALEREPLARDVARSQFDNARQALARAEEAYEERESLDIIEHNAYLALRNAQVAEQMIAEDRARDELEQGEAERTRVQLQARELEARRAEREATQALAFAEQRASDVEQQVALTEEERQRADEAERALADLEAEQTERGLVLTLGDVLFDTNRAVLKAGAESTLQRLAHFMTEYPERRVLVEGHTDATGSDEYNRELSARRADTVREALMEHGIPAERIRTRGLGEAYPLASNDTAGGRQLNRRVEIVVSDQGGQFPSAAERSASSTGWSESTSD